MLSSNASSYPRCHGNRINGRTAPPPRFPDACPVCGAGQSSDVPAVYACGGGYAQKSPIQNHTDVFDGFCPVVKEAVILAKARGFDNETPIGVAADWLAEEGGRPELAEALRRAEVWPDVRARKLLDSLTVEQRDEVGTILGMSNCGMDRFATPEQIAETDRDFRYFMVEINAWRKRLRRKGEKWGWCDDLDVLVAEAKKRRPGEPKAKRTAKEVS